MLHRIIIIIIIKVRIRITMVLKTNKTTICSTGCHAWTQEKKKGKARTSDKVIVAAINLLIMS
jgi:hypothetical protein